MDEDSRQSALVGLQIFLLSIAIGTCALRVYSRMVVVHSLAIDDYLMIGATVVATCLAINACLGSAYGWGAHLIYVNPKNYTNILLVGWTALLLFTLATSIVKISILSFYLRLANTRTYRMIIYVSIAWLTIWCITFSMVVIFQCKPISSYWHPTTAGQNPHCFKADVPFVVNGVTNILNDLFVYVLPMPMLWGIQLPRRQRIGLLAIFGVGAIVCVAGALRLYYSIKVNNSFDGTYLGFTLWTWEAVEVDLGIACACVPAVKPLLVRKFPRLMDSMFGASSRATGYAANQANASNNRGVMPGYGGGSKFASINSSAKRGDGFSTDRSANLSVEGITKESSFTMSSIQVAKVEGSSPYPGVKGYLAGDSEESLTEHVVAVTANPYQNGRS